MNAVLTMTTWLESAFAASSAFLQQSWLQAFRTQQLEKFLTRGFPTRREEEWKYIDVTYLEKNHFSIPHVPAGTESYLDRYAEPAIVLVFKNGYFSSEMSNLDLLPAEVI